MKWRNMNGWAEAVAQAKQLWPELPAHAFELAGDLETTATYGEAPWFAVHPRIPAEMAAKLIDATLGPT